MATIINTPGSGGSDNSGVGLILGVLIALVLVGLFVVYALPGLRRSAAPAGSGTNINIVVPNPITPNPTPAPVSQ